MATASPFPLPHPRLDPLYHAQLKFRRLDFPGCIELCDALLRANPRDQAVWFLKCRALTEKVYVDDTEMEEEGISELLLDDNAMAQAPRPGTSIARPGTSLRPGTRAAGGVDAVFRPMTASGRPLTGFARPGTMSGRSGLGTGAVDGAFRAGRPGTTRPTTTLGRQVRLGTASLAAGAGEGPFLDVERLDLSRYAARPAIAKALCDYILYVDHNPRKALELASAATQAAGFGDWWWKSRLGKAYYQLGLLRDAETQLKSALRSFECVSVVLELAKVYQRLDQPGAAHEVLAAGTAAFPNDVSCRLASARLHDLMGDSAASQALYREILARDPANVEAVACLAATYFYTDQPEVALKYYRRLLQVGGGAASAPAELWNNLGLCCFFAGQFDMTLGCFERALARADDDSDAADIWFNIGHVGVGIGDTGLAYQAFRVATSLNPNHAEAHNNLGVLEARRGGAAGLAPTAPAGAGGAGSSTPTDKNTEAARVAFATAARQGGHLFEPLYNSVLLARRVGDVSAAFALAQQAAAAFPGHADTAELLRELGAELEQI